MATTTVKTWCEVHGDPTAEGLVIGGIRITYAELEDLEDRAMALDRGVTEDLIEMWEQQGGRDYSQLLDWLYRYAEETRQDQPLCDPPTTELEVKITLWSEGRDPSECGIIVGGTRITAEDLEMVTSRQESEALGIPGDLFDLWQSEQPSWLFLWWLEERAKSRKRGAR